MYHFSTKQFWLQLFCILVLFHIHQPLTFAQSEAIDSLKEHLNESRGPEKSDIYYELSYQSILVGDINDGLFYADKALEAASQFGDSLRMVKAGKVRGSSLRRLERLSDAISSYQYSIGIATRNNFDDELKILLNSQAVTHTYLAEYDKALELYFSSLLLREKADDQEGISITYNNIGLVYFKLKNFQKAIEFYSKAVSLKNAIQNNRNLDEIYINIGLCYNQLNNYSKAKEFFNKGLSLCRKNTCSNEVLISGEYGLGMSSYGLQQYDEAKALILSSLHLSNRTGNKLYQIENLLTLGKILVKQGHLPEAKKTFKKAISTADSIGFNQPLIDSYKELYQVFNNEQDYEQAARYQQMYISLKDSIYSEALIENLSRIQTNFAERENIKTIEDNKIIIKQQRDLSVAIAIILILAGLLILVLQRSNRVSKRVNAQLSEAKETIQQQNQLLEIKNKNLDIEVEKKTADLERVNISLKQVNEELDNFIYKTSHDIRGPLASLKGMCNVALMDVKDPVALEYLRKLDTTAERLNSILTRLLIINQINNSKLSTAAIDFHAIIQDILLLEKKKGLPSKVSLRTNVNVPAASTIQSDKELVRIVLENLIDNAIKFYNESERIDSFVDIAINAEPNGFVKASITDNGIGISESNPGKLFQMFFRASERSEIGGIGLYIVKTATSKLGGKVGLLTTPEGYTQFYVLFPPAPPSGEEWTPQERLSTTTA